MAFVLAASGGGKGGKVGAVLLSPVRPTTYMIVYCQEY